MNERENSSTLPSLPKREETKLVEVRPDRVDLPPSIAGNSFENMVYGPLAGQPSRTKREEPSKQPFPWFWVILAAMLFCIFYFRNTDPDAKGPMPTPIPPTGLR